MYMEEWKARHFAKHLANRELLRKGLENDTSPKLKPNGETDNIKFNEFLYKAIIDTNHEVNESRAVTDALNLNLNQEPSGEKVAGGIEGAKEEKPKKKGGRPKKVKEEPKAKPKEVSDEDEFEGLEK